MDDFERELTRMMRDTRQASPFEPAHQQRLYAGIRTCRRSRMLWRAGGSALAVAGIAIGLALLPALGSGPPPADRPLPATTPTPPPAVPSPTTSAPAPDAGTPPPPATTPPVASDAGIASPESTPASVPPPATATESTSSTATQTPPGSSTPTPQQARRDSVSAGLESAGPG